jgi:hypothetical protein
MIVQRKHRQCCDRVLGTLRHHWIHHARDRRKKIFFKGLVFMFFAYCGFLWMASRSLNGELDGTEELDADEAEANNNGEPEALVSEDMRCAICFFGLPRSFGSLVLPSLERNVFMRNAKYGCDYFVHYYDRKEEAAGRAGYGGEINSEEVLMIKEKVQMAAKPMFTSKNPNPAVVIVKDTEEDFWSKRGAQVNKYRTTKASDGHYLYYPWKARTYRYPESLDNIVKQWYVQAWLIYLLFYFLAQYLWPLLTSFFSNIKSSRHSIQSVWEAMEAYLKENSLAKYDRVAMLRLDVLYALPLDIFKTERGTVDKENKYCVSPGFAKYPVNDRLFYGPYDAVKIWATERFSRVDNHVRTYEAGWGMHAERFLDSAIFSAIKEAGFPMTENPDICVMRVRADSSVWMNDCITFSGTTRGMKKLARQKLVESIIGRPCVKTKLRRFFQLQCPVK